MVNEKCDLISVLYHIAKGAQTYEAYAKDGEQAGDRELAQYFREVEEQHESLAGPGEKLLGARSGK